MTCYGGPNPLYRALDKSFSVVTLLNSILYLTQSAICFYLQWSFQILGLNSRPFNQAFTSTTWIESEPPKPSTTKPIDDRARLNVDEVDLLI